MASPTTRRAHKLSMPAVAKTAMSVTTAVPMYWVAEVLFTGRAPFGNDGQGRVARSFE